MANRRSSASQLPPPGRSSGHHPIYHGIRLRGGKWASEIREPNKSTRIWLGTFPTPEMAAAAYDVAALALRGPNARLNLPDSVLPNTLHEGSTADDIRAAAARAAASRSPPPEYCENDGGGSGSGSMGNGGFMDDNDETVFDTPMSMVMEMAEGMLLSPPRMEYISPEDESSVYYSGGGSLWNY